MMEGRHLETLLAAEGPDEVRQSTRTPKDLGAAKPAMHTSLPECKINGNVFLPV